MLKNYSNIILYENSVNSVKEYLNDKGEKHRLDGPAVEYSDGSKFWYINGIRHQNIDPSSEWSDGEKRWWFQGETHRIGGSFSSDEEWWCIHDKGYTKHEYFNIVWDI